MREATLKGYLCVLMILVVTSCSLEQNCEDTERCPEEQTERIDILIEGGLDIWESNIVDIANEKTGPVDYEDEIPTDGEFNVILHMSTGEQLALRLKSNTSEAVFDEFDIPFTAFPGEDLQYIARYISAEYRKEGDVATFSTNPGFEFNAPQSQNSFHFVSHENDLLSGRIANLTLYQVNDVSNTIVVNGTFVGYMAK